MQDLFKIYGCLFHFYNYFFFSANKAQRSAVEAVQIITIFPWMLVKLQISSRSIFHWGDRSSDCAVKY